MTHPGKRSAQHSVGRQFLHHSWQLFYDVGTELVLLLLLLLCLIIELTTDNFSARFIHWITSFFWKAVSIPIVSIDMSWISLYKYKIRRGAHHDECSDGESFSLYLIPPSTVWQSCRVIYLFFTSYGLAWSTMCGSVSSLLVRGQAT